MSKPDIVPVSAWLAQVAHRSDELKASVRAARVNHCLSDRHFNKIQTSVANIMSAVAEAFGPYDRLGAEYAPIASLPDFISFPGEKAKCPKCRRSKPRFRNWRPGNDNMPEHVEHKCECGYFIITKPADLSADSYDDGLFEIDDYPYSGESQ